MIYIDIKKLQPSKAWADKSALLTEELKKYKDDKVKRDEIIDKNRKVWKDLKGDLKKLSYGKCWYSEARDIYSHYHVDHFRPKKKAIDFDGKPRDGYWWLVFEQSNFRLCGSVGNTRKVDHFAVKTNCALSPDNDYHDEVIYLLDPANKRDCSLIAINEDGKIVPFNTNDRQWDNIRARYTIDKLDLDYPDLRQARMIKWKKVKLLIDEVEILESRYNSMPSAKAQEKLERKLNEIRAMLAPCEELSSTVKNCLRASRKDWAILLLSDAIDEKEYCKDFIIPNEIDQDED